MATPEDVLACLTDSSSKSVSDVLRLFRQLAEEYCPEGDRDWAGKELAGYDGGDELPPYRIAAVESRGVITNRAYFYQDVQVDGLPLPDGIREWADSPVRLREGLPEIEDLLRQSAAGEGALAIEWPLSGVKLLNYAIQSGEVPGVNNTYFFMRISKVVPRGVLLEILEQVRLRISDRLTKGSGGKSPISSAAKGEVSSAVTVRGNYNQVIMQSPGASLIQLGLEAGDLEGLLAILEERGIPMRALDEFRNIVESEPDDENGRLRKALEWAKRLALSGPVEIGTGVLSGLILHYFGLG